MRKCLTVFLLLSLQAAAQTRSIPVEPIVQNVTIFTQGARVERSAPVTLAPGRTEIVFSGMSNQLDPQSVQLKSDAQVTLLSVQATKDFLTQRRIDTEERSFRERIAQLKEKTGQDEKTLDIYNKEVEMLVKNQAIGGQTGVKAPELKAALDLHRQRLTEVYDRQLEISRRIASQERELARLEKQLAVFGRKRDSIQYLVTALVESKEAKTVRFQLLYNVKDAGWYPSYDVRVNEVGKPLAVLMNANVQQRSGETWKDVALTLSTGSPSDNATPSQLQPWMLGFYDPAAASYRSGAPGEVSGRIIDQNGAPVAAASIVVAGTRTGTVSDANGYFRIGNLVQGSTLTVSAVGYQVRSVAVRTGYYTIPLDQSSAALEEVVVVGYSAMRTDDNEGARRTKAPAAGIQTVRVETAYQPTSTVYKIEEKYSLETDGKTTTIGIKSVEVPASYDYYAAPKVDPAAFLNARITGWQELDLVSGEASLYFEGAYLGKTYLDLSAAGDTLTLALGKDNNIRITRKMVKEYSTRAFIGLNRTDSRQWEIVVRNNKRVPVSLTLADQFPVSTTKEIDVNDQKAPEADYNKENGLVTWQLLLPAGQEKKLSLSYKVRYPKEKRVVLE